METKVPFQYSKYGNIIKSFLHTKIGANIGYFLKIKGFNRVGYVYNNVLTGKKKYGGFAYNSRVNKGADLIASLITGVAQNSITSPFPPKYIALSTASLTPSASDTTLTGETSATGLTRVLATISGYTSPASLDAACSYVLSNTFTNNSGGVVTVVSSALFDAITGGNMFAEANLSGSSAMNPGDTLIITWTVNA
jgi:hypothetical protein